MKEIDSDVCIYCKKPGSSREHVAPSSLGGNCVIRCVCKPCNTALSVVDQALAENSPVALSKVGMTPSAAFATQLGSIASLKDEKGFDLGVRVGNQMKVEVRPQIFLCGDQLHISVADLDGASKLLAYIEKAINGNRFENTRQQTDAGREIPRFIMHRSDDAVVHATSQEEGSKLLSVIAKNWPALKEQLSRKDIVGTTQDQPTVLIQMTMRPNDEYRGIAKIAFETAALLLGPDVVLQESFDPLRAYILGDVRLPTVNETDPQQLAIDTRFATRLAEDFPFSFTEHHGVILHHNPQFGLAAFVILYGVHHYKVYLAPALSERSWMRHYEFMYTKDGHQELDHLAFAKRALERFPDSLNIDPSRAAVMLDALNGKPRDGWKTEEDGIVQS